MVAERDLCLSYPAASVTGRSELPSIVTISQAYGSPCSVSITGKISRFQCDRPREVLVESVLNHVQAFHERDEASQRPAAPASTGSRKAIAAPCRSSSVGQRRRSSTCIVPYLDLHSPGG